MKKIILEHDLLVNLVNKYKFKKDICDELHISVETLNKNLKYYGIPFTITNGNKGRDKITDFKFIDKKWLIDNWVNTDKSLTTLARELNVNDSLLECRASKYGVTKKYKYTLNKSKLFNDSDPNIAYLAGLLITDGYLNPKHDSVEISLTGDDEKVLLQSILDYLECNSCVQQFGKSFRIRLATDGIKQFFFDKFNLTDNNKTFTATCPYNFVNDDCAKGYIRGCIDGDGCISHLSRGGTLAILTASRELILGIQSIIKRYCNIEMFVCEERGYWGVKIGGKKCQAILDWVYSLENCFRLERKYKSYLNIIR